MSPFHNTEAALSATDASFRPSRSRTSPTTGTSAGQSTRWRDSPFPLPLALRGAGSSIQPARCSRSRPTRQLISLGCPRASVHPSTRHTRRATSARTAGSASCACRRTLCSSPAVRTRPPNHLSNPFAIRSPQSRGERWGALNKLLDAVSRGTSNLTGGDVYNAMGYSAPPASANISGAAAYALRTSALRPLSRFPHRSPRRSKP